MTPRNTLNLPLVAGMTVLVFVLAGGWAQTSPAAANKNRGANKLPAGASKFLNVPYVAGAKPGKSSPGSVQTLDLYVPKGAGPFPLVIWIHGGGWHGGDKESGIGWALKFLPKGFAIASLNYRLSPDAPFPAQIEDCYVALAWLRKNASKYHLDPNRVGAVGNSAGAHLAALMAVAADGHRFSKEAGPLQAVACFAGPFDLDRVRGKWPASMFAWNPDDLFCKTFFPGGAYDLEFAREASPSSYVHAGLPPFLIVNGDQDKIVPAAQAEVFAESLKKAGTDVSFHYARGKDHDGAMNADEALAFFGRTLSKK
jgi:acetyl esterase/lipase